MISRLQVQNYRVLRDIDCSLERFTCIVGPNGCGKSTILEVLEAALLSQGGGSSSPEPFRVNLCFPYRSGEALIWKRIVFNSREAPATWSIEPSDPASDLVEKFKDVPPAFWGGRAGAPAVCVQPRFSLETLKAASLVALPRGALPVDGTGLAGLLADWKLEDDPRFLRVQQQLEMVVPQIRGLFPRREGSSYQLFFLVGPEKKKIPAHEMSTGTLYTLALLVLLESLEQRSVLLLVDDLDRDLHPEAQGVLVGHLRGLLELNPELQILATSHSPYLVDHFLGSEVRVMALDHEGYGCISPMTAHPDYHRLGKTMRPGEFWSAVGERWVSTKGGQTP